MLARHFMPVYYRQISFACEHVYHISIECSIDKLLLHRQSNLVAVVYVYTYVKRFYLKMYLYI